MCLKELVAALVTVCLSSPAGGVSTPERPNVSVVAPYCRSGGPAVLKLATVFLQGKQPGAGEVLVGPDPQACVSNFAAWSAPFDAVVAQQWPAESVAGQLAWQAERTSGGAVSLIGQRQLVVVVNDANELKNISFSALHRLLVAPEGDKGYLADKSHDWRKEWPPLHSEVAAWADLGRKIVAQSHVYMEGKSSWSAEVLKLRVLKRSQWTLGYPVFGSRPFRSDIVECMDGDDVIKRVKRDPYGIGFVQYTGQALKGVKVLAVQDDSPDGWPGDYANPGPLLPVAPDGTVDVSKWQTALRMPKTPVALKLGRFLQPEYPLSEPLLLFVHPKAPQNVKDFAKWCVSEEGSAVAESLGLITPRMDAESKAQERLAALRNGEGTPIGLCGDGSLRKMMRQIGFAYTREKQAVVLKYEPAKPEDVAKVFVHERYPAMLSFESPNTATVAGEWAALEAAGMRKSAVAARALAVVVHPSNPRRSFTAVELQQVLSGTLRDWRALPAAGGAEGDMGDDYGIRLYLPERQSTSNRLLVKRMNLTTFGKCERLESDQEILAAVSADPGAVGVVSVASLPANVVMGGESRPGGPASRPPAKGGREKPAADPAGKQGFAVVAIGERRVLPVGERLMAGEYLLTEYLVAYQRADAPELTKSVLGEGLMLAEVRAAMGAAGMVPLR